MRPPGRAAPAPRTGSGGGPPCGPKTTRPGVRRPDGVGGPTRLARGVRAIAGVQGARVFLLGRAGARRSARQHECGDAQPQFKALATLRLSSITDMLINSV